MSHPSTENSLQDGYYKPLGDANAGEERSGGQDKAYDRTRNKNGTLQWVR